MGAPMWVWRPQAGQKRATHAHLGTPPLVVPHPREDDPPPTPWGRLPSDGPPPPPGDRTTTVHAHLQAQKLQHGEVPNRHTVVQDGLAITVISDAGYASPCSECPTTCTKTGSSVERMNIAFVPGGNMFVLSSSILAKVSKMSCHECKGYMAVPHNTVTHTTTQ